MLPTVNSTPPSGTLPARIFGPGRSASTPTWRPTAGRRRADQRQPLEVLVDRAVAEVEAADVGAGPQQRLEGLGVAEAGPSVATILVRRVTPPRL